MNHLFQINRLLRQPQAHSILHRLYSAAATGSKEHIDKLVKNNKVVLFMKGIPDQPQCGFSNGMVQILRMHGVESFDSYDVLSDEAMRQGIKDYSNWPTIPQLFLDGEFVGGLDIVFQMHQNGELIDELKKVGIRSSLLDDTGKEK